MTKKKKKKKESWKERRRRAALKQQKALEAERLKRERQPKKSKGWTKGKTFAVVFAFLLIIGIYGAWQYSQSSPSGSGQNQNTNRQKAPLFTLTDIDGNDVSLENLTGKVVILDFFYVGCPHCPDEFVELEQIYKTYSSEDITIISISVNPDQDTVDRLREYKTGPNQYTDVHYQIYWTIARDTIGIWQEYNIPGTPTTVIIDKEGYISPNSPFAGVTAASVLKNEIDSLLYR